MANVKISQLPAATTPLGGNEELPLVQNSTTKKTLVSSINAKATLQQVTASTNKNLTNGINLQGTGAGGTNSGINVNAFGTSACGTNTGSRINAFGNAAASGNSGTDVNAMGDTAAGGNTGSNVNSMGNNSCSGNDGSDVNAFGDSAGKDNQANDVNFFGNNAGFGNVSESVNIFGRGAVADDKGQAVFGIYDGNTTYNARLSYKDISDDRKYELPDASGTLVLSVNGNAPDAQGDVVVGGGGGGPQVTTVSISSAQILNIFTSPVVIVSAQGANKIIVPMQIIHSYTYGTTQYTGSSLILQIGSPLVNVSGVSNAYLALQNTISSATNNLGGFDTLPLVNTNLVLTTSGVVNPTGGNGTLKVTVIYNVITV